MKQLKQIISIIFTLTFFSACTERVNIDLEMAGESKLAVFAEITDETKAHAVYLTKSMPYFSDEETPVVTGATVSISNGTETVSLTEEPDEPGTYYTPRNYKGVPGTTYRLEISDVDVNEDGVSEAYSAETIMSRTMPVEGVIVGRNNERNGWDVALFASEPGETKDYYLFKVYKNGVLFSDTISNYRIYDDKFFNGKVLKGVIVQFFDAEKGEIVERDDEITLEVAGITEEYFSFIDALKEEIDEKYPMFSGPAANLKGNISNGALGFFAAMAVSKGSVTYRGE
jgi:hypothetical protein